MTSVQCRLFSQTAAESRLLCMGKSAFIVGGTTITVVCQPLNSLGLAEGGFEQAGQMKALVYGATIPSVHAHLRIEGKTWAVTSKIESLHSVETALLLEAVPA